MQKMNYYIIPILIISLGVVARLIPHPPNFAPIAAIALFGGIYLPKPWGILAPLAALFFSDLLIGFYAWPIMASVYLSLAATGLIGLWIKQQKNIRRIISGTLVSSSLFFLITNWAVWVFGTMYPPNLNGLFESYTMALPFFRNSLLGDFFYVGLLVGGYELVSQTSLRHRLHRPHQCE